MNIVLYALLTAISIAATLFFSKPRRFLRKARKRFEIIRHTFTLLKNEDEMTISDNDQHRELLLKIRESGRRTDAVAYKIFVRDVDVLVEKLRRVEDESGYVSRLWWTPKHSQQLSLLIQELLDLRKVIQKHL